MTQIIAELCQNHTGSTDTLAEMVEAAADAGADYAKIQTIFADDVTPRGRFEHGETEANGVTKTIERPYKPEYERLADLELSIADHERFIELCEQHGVTPLTTVFSRKRIPDIASLPWPEKTIKIASYDCASVPMLRELAEHFDTFFVSTGGTYDEEVEETAAVLDDLGVDYTFLHCVTSYPNTLDMCNLSRMEWLESHSPQVGWSDHTDVDRDGILATKAAIALGADVVERHFTVFDREATKDGPVSITPSDLVELRAFADASDAEQEAFLDDLDELDTLRGQPDRKMTHEEILNRDYYRGRFASFDPESGEWIYNWEDVDTPWT
jgi:N,N'-diacetyllegionaminate synthase